MMRRGGRTFSTGFDLVVRYGVHPVGVRTSEVAAQAQVNTQTLRYYERRGLLPAPERTSSGYRATHSQCSAMVLAGLTAGVHPLRQIGFVTGAPTVARMS
jgi:hypothetical protein